MSNMVRIFTGTVENVVPQEHESNPFRSLKPYHHGNQPYQLAWVALSEPTTEAPRLLCYADFPLQPGDTVTGLSCRRLKGTPVGILLEKDLEPLLAIGNKFEWLAEYTAFRLHQDANVNRDRCAWYLKYPNNDGEQVEPIIRSLLDTYGQGSIKAVLATAHVDSCSSKNQMMFCTATLSMHIKKSNSRTFSFQIRRYVDYELEAGKNLSMLVYLGQESNPAIHMLPLASTFSHLIQKLDEQIALLMVRFLAGNAFRVLGRTLFVSDPVTDSEDNRCRIMITSKAEQDFRYYARPLSLYNGADPNRDVTCTTKKRQLPGNVMEAEITTGLDGTFNILRTVSPRTAEKESAPLPKTSKQAHTPSEPTQDDTSDSGNLLTMREHEISLWRDDPSADAGSVKKDYSFRAYKFQYALLNREIDTLHYDVLHWIGMLNYTTGNHIFWLFLSGILPQDPDALNDNQKRDAATILENVFTKPLVLPEGSSTYTSEYTIRVSGKADKLNKILNKLRILGLIEQASFRTQQNISTPSKVLILTEAGKNLLKALQRRNTKYDNFAYLRPIRHVKTILSANQLCIAYIQGLNKLHPIQPESLRIGPTIVVRHEGSSDDSMVRVGFTLPLRNGDGTKTVMLMGESIRNTVGLSKQLDDKSIREKIPRMLSIVRRSAELEKRHTVLTMVFTSYDELVSYAPFIRDELNKLDALEYFHVYLTYDMLLMGTLDGSHFRFHPVTGDLERVNDMTAQIESYLQ